MTDRVPTRASTRCCGSGRWLAVSLVKTVLLAVALLTGVVTDAFAQGSISGNVTSSTTGLGLANVGMGVFSLSTNQFVPMAGMTDVNGNYTVNLSPGTYALFTRNTEGYINEIYDNIPCSGVCDTSSVAFIEITNNAVTGIDFTLDPGGLMTGRVTQADGMTPIAGVTVYFVDSMGQLPFTDAVTDAMGNFVSKGGTGTGSVYAVTTNTQGYRDEVFDDVYCSDCDPTDDGTAIPVTLAGGASNINFALDLGGNISGTVTTEAGAPVAGVEVNFFDSTGNRVGSVDTDAMGNYTSSGLLAGDYYVATDEGAVGLVDELFDNFPCVSGNCNTLGGTKVTVTVGATASGKNFVLAPGGTVTGTVTDSMGVPLDNVFVGFNTVSTTPGATFNQAVFVGGEVTNDSGVYSAVVPTGTNFASVTNAPSGFANQIYHGLTCPSGPAVCSIQSGTPFLVNSGETTGNIDFSLAPSSGGPGGSISGTVTNSSAGGASLNNIQIQIFSLAGTLLGSTTSVNGFYQFNGLAPGSYYLRTNNTNFINQLFHSPNNVECINCNVVTSGGSPLIVDVGFTVTANFPLQTGGRISGTITDGTTGLTGVAVQIYSSAGDLLVTNASGASGFYVSAALPAGNYYVRTAMVASRNFIDKLWTSTGGVACVPCTVTTGDIVTIVGTGTTPNTDFVLSPGGSIGGTVTDAASGAPIPAMGVLVFNSAGVLVKNATTDSSGDYTAAGLPAGDYFVRANPNAARQNYVGQLYNGFPLTGLLANTGTPVDVTVGNTQAGINFALASGGAMSGTVTGNGGLGPLVGVQIVAYSSAGEWVKNLVTDAVGGFTMHGLQAGHYYVSTNVGLPTPFHQDKLFDNIPCLGCVTVSGQNFPIVTLPCALPCTPTVTTGTPVMVTNGATRTGVDFFLGYAGEAGGISGTVYDLATGIGLPNVQVLIYNAAGNVVKNVTSAANTGIFLVRGLPPGTYYARTIVSPATPYYTDVAYHLPSPVPCAPCDVTTAGTAITVIGGGSEPIAFPMTAGGAISGSVFNETTTNPLASVDVQLFNNAGTLVKTTFTGSTGKLEFDGLPAGTYYARTADELYLNTACDACVPTDGDPIDVVNGATHGGINFGLTPSIPTVVTTAATGIMPTGATLNGTVNPNGSSATALFQYGLTTGYGSQVAASPAPGSGMLAVAVSAAITGLTCDTPYHFRLKATSAGATTNGLNTTFMTGACPTIAPMPNVTTKVNTPIPVPVTVGSTAGAADVILTASSSNQTVVPNANLMFIGNGANRTLEITPAASQKGVTTITVTASDATGTVDASFTALVTSAITPLVPGTRSSFALADPSDERWDSIVVVAGRSYCAQLAPGATAVNRASPTLAVFRGDAVTPLGTPGAAGTCFVAPADETALVRVTQADVSARAYMLRVVETTLWSNWWFVGGNYSSYTLLRNTTRVSINATLTWRDATGAVVGTETVVVPARGIAFLDARPTVTGAVSGSVEVGHDGEPQGLTGSQTTISGETGLSFDTLLMQRFIW